MKEILELLPLALVVLSWVGIEYLYRKIKRLSADLDIVTKHLLDSRRRGIYTIQCLPNGANYVGSTRTNFLARWGQHIRDLDNGRHVNARLQDDWNKYGRDAFLFLASEVIDDPVLIIERENTILDYRAQHLPPILNYNVNRSRTYPVPAPVEDGQSSIAVPRRAKRQEISDDKHAFCLADLDLTPEEIAAIEGTKV